MLSHVLHAIRGLRVLTCAFLSESQDKVASCQHWLAHASACCLADVDTFCNYVNSLVSGGGCVTPADVISSTFDASFMRKGHEVVGIDLVSKDGHDLTGYVLAADRHKRAVVLSIRGSDKVCDIVHNFCDTNSQIPVDDKDWVHGPTWMSAMVGAPLLAPLGAAG